MYSVLSTLSKYTYFLTYRKTLLHALLLLVFKIVQSLQCILKIKCAEGSESSSFVYDNKIMSRFLLIIFSKESNLLLIDLMFKCPTIFQFLQTNFSFIDSISREVCYYHFDSMNSINKLFFEPSTLSFRAIFKYF